jgi:hypothetical protein
MSMSMSMCIPDWLHMLDGRCVGQRRERSSERSGSTEKRVIFTLILAFQECE